MLFTNQLRIHLSLVSHTNIGKTTLARTLLMRDVGEVADRAHVTETTDDYVLARDTAGCELVLWDTPGFGNSVALAKRLAGRSNPVGWFLSEVWDRMTNKAFWLNQRAIRHVRDISSVVLYLVNASELPKKAPYITAEMQILSWIGKPVIILLNQMGKPKAQAEEQADVDAWREAMRPYPFVRDILPMDAFARCWVQEAALFDAIGKSLPVSLHAAFETLRDVWVRARRALYRSSVDAMARHMWKLLQARELVEVPSLRDHVISFAAQLGILKKKNAALEDAQTALSTQAADSLCALTDKLLAVNGLNGAGISKEILRRMKSDWDVAAYSIDPGSAAAVGAGVGVAGGAAAGAAADFASAGLSLGLGTLLGGILGAIGGVGAAAIYNARHKKEGIEISWSEQAAEDFMLETLLLYLAVAHFGRGRGDWQAGESPEFWKQAVTEAMKEQKTHFQDLRRLSPEAGVEQLTRMTDTLLRTVFLRLYGRGI
ncbi:MAG: GTPase domain-containing protein [Sutterella sp.]|nr:GTPase domain-containing protein [Sutterella sp.]